MLKLVGTQDYEVTHLELDEQESERLEEILHMRSEAAVRCVHEAVERAEGRLTNRPLSELLAHK
jgi:hypothetical protein